MALRGWAAALAAALLLPAGPLGAQAALRLRDLPDRVLASDPAARAADSAALVAYHGYRSILADAFPKVDLLARYDLAYTPEATARLAPSPAPVTEIRDQATHLGTARIGITQILPTAGTLSLGVENVTTASVIGERTTGDQTTNPDPDFRQTPKLTLGISQPVLLNGKLIDFSLFPATLRKARTSFEREDAGRRAARNQAVGRAVELYLSVVELRGAEERLAGAVDLALRRLEVTERSHRLGTVTDADLLAARLGASEQKGGLLDARAARMRVERLLADIAGLSTLQGLDLPSDLPAFRMEGEPAALRERAAREHPLVAQAALLAEERALDEPIGGQRHASTLTLGLSVSPRYPYREDETVARNLDSSLTDLFAEGWGRDWTASAGLSIRIFQGGKRTQDREAARALTEAARASLAGRRQSVLDELDLSLERRPILEERAKLLEQSVGLASSRLEIERSLSALGSSTSLDVGSRELELRGEQARLWRVRADLVILNLGLAASTGADLAPIVAGWGG